MTYRIILLILSVTFLTSGTSFRECTFGKTPTFFRIHNCNSTANVCKLKRNVDVIVETSFKPDSNVLQLSSTMSGKMFGIWFEFDLEDKAEVCRHLTIGQCPLKANTNATYKLVITVPSYAPKQRADIRLVINNERNNILACAISTVQIID